ncbi:MAG: multiheme c-type cytochrome [Thermoleophilia bacterium]
MRRSVLFITLGLAGAALLAAAVPALGADFTAAECVQCHAALTPKIVSQYASGAMAGAGVTCVTCHGADHAVISQHDGQVPASTCAQAGCHPEQYAEFAATDGAGAYLNKHAIGWTRMTAAARYSVMPAAQRYEMCERCHNIGYVSADGSVGKCDSCHTRHTFSAAEAAEPEACGTCHMGPDHEQIDMWEKSKHGVVYTTEKERAGGDPSRAPTCVTCHMPEPVSGGGNGGGQALVHDVSTNLTLGTVAQGARLTGVALPVTMRTIGGTEFDRNRGRMESICGHCHAPSFVEKNLEGADQIKADVDTLLWDPVMRIRGLWYDGLLDPMPVNRDPNPIFGQNLVLGGQQLYGGTSAIEQLFFNTYKYDHVNTFKGAYHINPDYSHWFGWARVNVDRDLIKGEEAKLRQLGAPGDAGFTVAAKATVGEPTTFDASQLAAWGDASANTYEWRLGDGAQAMPSSAAVLSYTYAAPGTYTAQLTCADSDLVNNSAAPTTCSAKRTTSKRVLVKYGATVTLAKPTGRATRTFRATLTTGSAGGGSVELWRKVGSGAWRIVSRQAVTTAAGTPLTRAFRVVVRRTARFRAAYTGDAQTWSAQSAARTVRPAL